MIGLELGFPGCTEVKNPPAGESGDGGSFPGLGRAPGVEKGNSFRILAWTIPWTEETGGLQSIGSQRVRHNGSNLALMHAYI